MRNISKASLTESASIDPIIVDIESIGRIDENTMLDQPQNQHPAFEQLLLEAIDEALCSLRLQKRSIYSYLNERFGIHKTSIPYEIEEFAKALEEIFGFGAKIIEIQIMKQLHEKARNPVRNTVTHADLVFGDYVQATKISYNSGRHPKRHNTSKPISCGVMPSFLLKQ